MRKAGLPGADPSPVLQPSCKCADSFERHRLASPTASHREELRQAGSSEPGLVGQTGGGIVCVTRTLPCQEKKRIRYTSLHQSVLDWLSYACTPVHPIFGLPYRLGRLQYPAVNHSRVRSVRFWAFPSGALGFLQGEREKTSRSLCSGVHANPRPCFSSTSRHRRGLTLRHDLRNMPVRRRPRCVQALYTLYTHSRVRQQSQWLRALAGSPTTSRPGCPSARICAAPAGRSSARRPP